MPRLPQRAVGVALCLLGLIACEQGRPKPALEPIRLGAARLRISLPLFVAHKRGILARHGLDATLEVYETAQPMLEEVVDGRIDAGGFVAYPIVLLASSKAKDPPQVVASLVEDAGHRLSYVLARPGSGVRFPAGAAGKRIGILPTVAYQRWLEAILARAGVAAAGVKVVPVAPPLQAQALASGAVDLLFTNDPMATAMIAAGAAEIVDGGPPCATHLGDPFSFGTFALAGRFARERPDAAARLVAALDEAIAEVRRDPAGARRDLAELLRPEERAAVARYPDARYLTSAEAGAAVLDAEIANEQRLGILATRPAVKSWSPAR